MPGITVAYVVAIFAMLLSACSALALIYTVKHFDSPETRRAPIDVVEKIAG